MDLAHILRELLRLRRWVAAAAAVALLAAVATVYKVSVLPPSVTSRSIEFGAASTQVIVDTPDSSVAVLDGSLENLSARAMVYGRVMTSNPVLDAIGREAGIPSQTIAAEGPDTPNVPQSANESKTEARGNELLGEAQPHRLLFSVEPELPLIEISAQAPSGEAAISLANGAATGFQKYVEQLQNQQRVKPNRRVKIRQLGRATGGMVNEGASSAAAVMAFVGVLVVGCIVVLVGANVARNWRVAAAQETDNLHAEGEIGHFSGSPHASNGAAPQRPDRALPERDASELVS